MVLISKKALVGLAKDLNAIDLTHDKEVRPWCEHLAKIAYTEGKYGCNGCLLKSPDGKFFVITDRTVALWVYFFC